MMQSNQQAPYAGLPEIIRVKATRGFRGVIDGAFGVAAPGDIVDVPRDLAVTLRFGQKAVMVDPGTKKLRQEDYQPERKKNPVLDPAAAQVRALIETVAALRDAVTAQGKTLEALAKK